MKTVLRGKQSEVTIAGDSPFVIIGEKINPTGRKKLAAALQEGNWEYVLELAKKQVDAGADVLDINVGVPGMDEVAVLPQVVKIVTEAFDLPVCLDSPNPSALAAALAVAPGHGPLAGTIVSDRLVQGANDLVPVALQIGSLKYLIAFVADHLVAGVVHFV